MLLHNNIADGELKKLIKEKTILLGGNAKLKIYGTLHCKSGKRMRKENRVFFKSRKEALAEGFRPCGNCLSKEYKKWTCSIQKK